MISYKFETQVEVGDIHPLTWRPAIKEAENNIAETVKPFDKWWTEVGLGRFLIPEEDMEEFVKKVAKAAWTSGELNILEKAISDLEMTYDSPSKCGKACEKSMITTTIQDSE